MRCDCRAGYQRVRRTSPSVLGKLPPTRALGSGFTCDRNKQLGITMSDHPLAGRTSLVTGGAKGIGRACCLRLAQAGANVAINYLTSDEQARETAELVGRTGVKAHLVCADVASPEQVTAMVDEVAD